MKDEASNNDQIEPSGKRRQRLRWLLIVLAVLFVCWLANYFVPLLGIPLLMVFIFLFSILIPQSRWLAVLFICGLSGLVVPMCGIPLILVMLLLLFVSTPEMKREVKIAIFLFVGGTILSYVARKPLMGLTFLFLPYIAAPILAIISSAIQLRGKPPCGRVTHVFLIIFIFGFSLINSRTYVILTSPYIYMPPALNNENLKVYKECIMYVKNHEELKSFIFRMRWLDVREMPSDPNAEVSLGKTLRRISNEPETAAITEQLKQIMCPWFERSDDIVIFYKGNNPFIPMTAKEIWHIWPSGHGVAYSLDGQDPNQSNDPILAEYKPFIRIHGNWYFSRGLFLTGDGRMYHSRPDISKTLIDSTLSLDGIDPNKLDENI